MPSIAGCSAVHRLKLTVHNTASVNGHAYHGPIITAVITHELDCIVHFMQNTIHFLDVLRGFGLEAPAHRLDPFQLPLERGRGGDCHFDR